MTSTRPGSLRLFRVGGIDLFLHWSWFLAAAFEISGGTKSYSSRTWNVLEYLALFLIVTLHEFGHALACRQVGGTANRIVLWPLGGVAYVNPPAHALLGAVGFINKVLLIFNLLPIYPLDGGQILRSLLWFVVGRARSLTAAVTVGFAGVAGLIVLAVRLRSAWFGALCVFILMNCWGGLRQAQALSRMAKLPRHEGFECPSCKAAPTVGTFWKCNQCRKAFDTFQTQGVCPYCAARFAVTKCLDCGRAHPMSEWIVPALVPPKW